MPVRQHLWQRLATDLRPRHLADVARRVPARTTCPAEIDRMLAGAAPSAASSSTSPPAERRHCRGSVMSTHATTLNVAHFLDRTVAADARSRRDRLRADAPHLRAARRHGPADRRRPARPRHRAGQPRRAVVPERRRLPGRLLRHPQGRRRRSCRSTCCSSRPRSPSTCATPTRPPTSASRGRRSCRWRRWARRRSTRSRTCRHFVVMPRDPGAAAGDRRRHHAATRS